MMKLYTAFTKEIDDPEAAVREITEQLKPAENALKNTIGIVHFYHECIETGVYQAVADSLPFKLVGCVSTYIGTNELYGDFAFSVTMLTSDDVNFSVHTVEDIDAKSREQTIDELTQVCRDIGANEKPKVVMAFLAPLVHFSGDDVVSIVNGLPEPFPIFGTVAFSGDYEHANNFVVNGSTASRFMCGLVALYGDIQPHFRVTTSFAYEEKLGDFTEIAEITEAEGPVLKTVNGVSVLEYLKKQGMINTFNAVSNSSVWAVPAILMLANGTKVARAFMGIVEGTEFIYSAGNLETGAKISFAYLDGEKTLSSAEKIFAEINEADEANVIAYSCAARSWALGTQALSEVKRISNYLSERKQGGKEPVNYCMSYSAGEICPLIDERGNMINIFHNYTLISCSF